MNLGRRYEERRRGMREAFFKRGGDRRLIKRLQDGTFAPSGRGEVLRPGARPKARHRVDRANMPVVSTPAGIAANAVSAPVASALANSDNPTIKKAVDWVTNTTPKPQHEAIIEGGGGGSQEINVHHPEAEEGARQAVEALKAGEKAEFKWQELEGEYDPVYTDPAGRKFNQEPRKIESGVAVRREHRAARKDEFVVSDRDGDVTKTTDPAEAVAAALRLAREKFARDGVGA